MPKPSTELDTIDAADRASARATELDTIDGLEGAPIAVIVPAPQLPAIGGDYPELQSVERRHYQVFGEIAKGGMGRVLDARDLRLGRAVAIKELLPRNRDAAKRFEREARITARLQHPAIIHVYEAGVWAGGEPFYAMNKVSGRSLDKVVAERPTLVDRLGLVPNVIAVADALAYAHNENIIHRDLKPSNVLVGAFGETVVIDWGLAKDLGNPVDPQESLAFRRRSPEDTNLGSVVGTPAYMAPEQARGENVDQRADVYALGALLYHVLVGAPPFRGGSSDDVLELVKQNSYVPIRKREPAAPADLVAIVTKAMALERADRYLDAGELATDLKRFYTGQLVAAREYTRVQLMRRWLAKHRVAVAISTLALIALAVLGIVSISQIVDEKAAAQRRRDALLQDRGREDLLAGNYGRALAYLAGTAQRAERGGRGFMLAEALRPFRARIAAFHGGASHDSVAFSPDRVATLDAGTIQIRDERGRPLTSFVEPDRTSRIARFDGRRVVVVDGAQVRVWTVDGVVEHQIEHGAPILDAELAADGSRIATVGADGKVRLQDLATGAVATMRQPVDLGLAFASVVDPSADIVSPCLRPSPVIAVRFSPDGARLVTANEDNYVCMWQSDGELMLQMPGHTAHVNSLRWSPDGEHVLSASADGTARLWAPRRAPEPDAQLVGKIAIAPLQHPSGLSITSAEFSSDGGSIVTAGVDSTVVVWDLPALREEDPTSPQATARLTLVGHVDAVEHAIFDADDRRIATAGRDKKAKVWDAATGQTIATFEHADAVTGIAFSKAGNLFSSSFGSGRIWDIQAAATQRSAHEADAPINAIAAAGSHTVAAGCEDRKIVLWRDDVPTVLRTHVLGVNALAFSPDERLLVSAGKDSHALVWDVANPAARPRPLGPLSGEVRAAAWSPDGATIALAGTDVQLWSAGVLASTLRDGPISQIAFHPAGHTLVGIGDGQLVTWQLAGVQPRGQRTSPTTEVRAFAFSPDGGLIVISGRSDTRIFAFTNGAVGDEVARIDGTTGDVRAVAFTADGSRVITASSDGVTRLWDASKGKLVGIRDPHGGAVRAIAISADGDTLWVGTEDQFVRAWDIRVESQPLDELEDVLRRVPWRLGDDDVARPISETGDGS